MFQSEHSIICKVDAFFFYLFKTKKKGTELRSFVKVEVAVPSILVSVGAWQHYKKRRTWYDLVYHQTWNDKLWVGAFLEGDILFPM